MTNTSNYKAISKIIQNKFNYKANHKSFKLDDKIRSQQVTQFIIDEIIQIKSIYLSLLKLYIF